MENIMDVMSNEMDEVIEIVEMTPAKKFGGLKVAGGAAAALAVGYGIYKGVKWIKAKRQAKKEQAEIEANCEPCEVCEDAE